jgi:hypothetical protein
MNKYIVVADRPDNCNFLVSFLGGGHWSDEYPDAYCFNFKNAKLAAKKFAAKVYDKDNFGTTNGPAWPKH